MKYVKIILLLILFLNNLGANASDNLHKIKNLLEGRYELVYWKQDNIKFNYPIVAGTLIVKDNNISFTLDNNIKENKTTKIIAWGNYTLTSKKYNYSFFDFKKVTAKEKDIKISRDLPWRGFREYTIEFKKGNLLLTSMTGKQTWQLDENSLIYKDKEWGEEKKQILRYWKRVK